MYSPVLGVHILITSIIVYPRSCYGIDMYVLLTIMQFRVSCFDDNFLPTFCSFSLVVLYSLDIYLITYQIWLTLFRHVYIIPSKIFNTLAKHSCTTGTHATILLYILTVCCLLLGSLNIYVYYQRTFIIQYLHM